MTLQEYSLMLSLIEKAKAAAMIAVRTYSPKDAPYVEVTDFDEVALELMGNEGWAGSLHHMVYLPLETMLVPPAREEKPLTAVIQQERFARSRAKTYCIHHFPDDNPAERTHRLLAFTDGYINAVADMNEAGN